jgi:hypothetical protein
VCSAITFAVMLPMLIRTAGVLPANNGHMTVQGNIFRSSSGSLRQATTLQAGWGPG